MEEVDRYYQGNITLEEAENYIASGLITAARAYVANGYYLRRIRDDRLYEEEPEAQSRRKSCDITTRGKIGGAGA